MSECKHNWHLYDFTQASLIGVGEKAKQLVPERYNFVCDGCGATKHIPPIKDNHDDYRQIIKQPPKN